MKHFAPMLAQEEMSVGKTLGAWTSMSEEARTRLVMVSIYAVVIGAVVAWALFIRKQKSKRRRIRKHHPHTWQQTENEGARRGRRHKRRTRSAELAPNPSLAEARGLPPRRPDDVPPAGA